MIKAEKATVEIEGNAGDLLAECACVLTAITDTVSEGDADFAAAAIYSVVMAAARELHSKGLDIDTLFLGIEITKATLK